MIAAVVVGGARLIGEIWHGSWALLLGVALIVLVQNSPDR